METNSKLKILESIGKIYEESKNCKLESIFFEKTNSELSFLSSYFGTTKKQTFLIAIVFSLNYKGNSVDFNDLIEYFDCNPMKILEYSDDFDYLNSINIFRKEKSKNRIQLAGANDQFIINGKISEAILKNQPLPKLEDETKNIFDLLEQVYGIGEKVNYREIAPWQMFMMLNDLLEKNTHFPLINKINSFKLKPNDTYLYLYLIWKIVSGEEKASLNSATYGIYSTTSDRINYIRELTYENSPLKTNNLIEFIEKEFINDTEVKLTDYSYDLLKKCGIDIHVNKKKRDDVISPDKIPFRKLIFNSEEMKQISLLKDLLQDQKFNEIQNRLQDKNMPKGIAILLHGAPGTGKTEIVKQFAKETNRELMKVEISQAKSKWFGDSEKIIKKIFTDYKSFAKYCDKTPILLFNEADAIISKRKEIGSSNTAQTENAIQNIILEELENFDGILFATTNLANNLDTAFERRFLFKILFQKPDTDIRAKIWQSRLSNLSIEDCRLLANKFDFSGGQIENIIRKKEIHEIIHGEDISLNKLVSFCSEETLMQKNQIKIGF